MVRHSLVDLTGRSELLGTRHFTSATLIPRVADGRLNGPDADIVQRQWPLAGEATSTLNRSAKLWKLPDPGVTGWGD